MKEQSAAEAASSTSSETIATADSTSEPTAVASRDVAYVRPVATPYRFTEGKGRYAPARILDSPQGQVAHAILTVVGTEAPIHLKDLAARVAGMWGQQVGAQIMARIVEIGSGLAVDGSLQKRRE